MLENLSAPCFPQFAETSQAAACASAACASITAEITSLTVTYNGPPTFARCLAARQLAWLVQQLQPSAFTDTQTLGLLLPLVLAVADDPSASVRQYGHAAMGWLGLQTPAASLRWQGDLLREEARRLVVGCEESCWVTAMPAATSLILVGGVGVEERGCR